MALQSSSSFTYRFTYDVFLSFRGSDTRYGFTGNLWKALSDRGIHTFIDDKDLERGDEITPALVKAIEVSRIAIPVFSNNYASSSFCLDELVNIIDRVKAKGRLVLPIFYGVDPSHVRHQTGSYGEALTKHKERFKNNEEKLVDNMERLLKWKASLHQVANLSGHHFKHGNEYEHEFVARIVKEVSNKINRPLLHVADFPVGLESRVLQVNTLLDFASDDGVHMVGIYGIGGMGKTTLARAVYNLIADQFEALCFLHNVRENSNKHGLIYLQEKLLSKTVGQNIELGDVNEGIPIIKQRLQRKKVLLILDDVDELKQLQVMVGGLDWFGPGSRVIITTRDKHLLASHGIKRTYEVDELNKKEALKLFWWNAFKDNNINPSCKDIVDLALTYASGLPLALEVIGSNLCGKSIVEWKYTLDLYERIPPKDIQKILKVSFDALEEEEKSVFLDIACCFKGYGLTYVEDILHAHYGNCMKHHIRVLDEKSLIKIKWSSQVTLHDLIEDMGKEIVRLESPKEPGKRSRLWSSTDINQVLEDNSGTKKIEIICLDAPLSEEAECDIEAFKKMKILKTLVIRNGHILKDLEHIPNSLRVLEWERYPSRYLPSDFHPKELVICKLPYNFLESSQLTSLLRKRFVNLKVLNVDRCECLKEIPDVSSLSNLEELSFQSCQHLTRIHDSVGFLDKLKILNASDCRMLSKFPPIKLTSLEQFELSFCTSLEIFPEILGKMENIRFLLLAGIPTIELPFSIQNLTRLQIIGLEQCGMPRLPSSIAFLTELGEVSFKDCKGFLLPNQNEVEGNLSSMTSSNIEYLNLVDCNLSDTFLLVCLVLFANVKQLDLSSSHFTIVPECIKECHILWKLRLDDCIELEEIRGIPPNLKYCSARNCSSLSSSSRSKLLDQEVHYAGNTDFLLNGGRFPVWVEHRSRGSEISFWFRNRNQFRNIVVCLATDCLSSAEIYSYPTIIVTVIINGYVYDTKCFGMPVNHTQLFGLQMVRIEEDLDKGLSEKKWNHVKVTYKISCRVPVLGVCGIHVFREKCTMKDIRFTDPYSKRKLDGNLNSSTSPSHPLLKKHRFVDMKLETQSVQPQQDMSLQQQIGLLPQQQRMAFWPWMWNSVLKKISHAMTRVLNEDL